MNHKWLALGIITLTASLAHAADPDVTVMPLNISETRNAKLSPDPKAMPPAQTIRISFKISGPDAKAPTNIGHWKFTEAVNDVGTSLLPKNMFFLENMQGVGEYQINKDDGSFTLDIGLEGPARKATKIASIKGEFTLLAGGEKKDVKIPAIKSFAGKDLDDPTLKAAGVSAKVIDDANAPKGGGDSVRFDIGGNRDAMLSLKLVDKDGKDLPGNCSWNPDEKNKVTHYAYYTQKVDADTGVVFTVVLGQKRLTVPVVLKDIPLP